MEVTELKQMAGSWERALTDIPTAEIQNCYDQAIRDYTEPEKPFGTPQLLRAWQFIVDEKRAHRARSVKPSADGPCFYCNDSGWQTLYYPEPYERITKEGEVYMTPPGQTAARPCACVHAPSGMRSDFPLREPNWVRESGGRWWSKVTQ